MVCCAYLEHAPRRARLHDFRNTETSPVPQEDPSEAHPLEQWEVCLPKHGEVEVTEQAKHAMLDEMQKVFASRVTDVCLHNYYECVETNCTKVSETEVSCFTSNGSGDRFAHSWLADKSLPFCQTI